MPHKQPLPPLSSRQRRQQHHHLHSLEIACRPSEQARCRCDFESVVWAFNFVRKPLALSINIFQNLSCCSLDTDVFGTADPFGSNSFGSKAGGFADFSQMSKVRGAGCHRNKSSLFYYCSFCRFLFAKCDFSFICGSVYLIEDQSVLIKENQIVCPKVSSKSRLLKSQKIFDITHKN